jgi:hypothetical protein
MASPPVDRMDKAQRRRLMATLLSSAIADGQLDSGAVDLAGLLFGDPDLWTDFQEHGAIVEDVIATSPSPVAPTHDRFVGKALPTAMQLIEDDVVGALEIHDAQLRNGAGKSGDDTEYRRIRAKLKNYTRYLAERSDYERLNRSLRDAYARPQMDQMAPADLAKEFSLPLADVALCLDEVQALVSILSAPEGIDPQSFVPKTKTGAARKKLVLLDTAGRPRWGRRKAGGARPLVKGPARKTMTSSIVQATPAGGMPAPTSTQSDARLPTQAEAAILQARLGLELDEAQTAALPIDWATAMLPVAHIIRLLPYPRLRRLDTALAVFGHPALRDCIEAERALTTILEEQAATKRHLLLQQANEGPPRRRVTPSTIADRWWRAMRFYVDCGNVSVSGDAADVWPEPWEYISAARDDIYTAKGRDGVRELAAIVDIAATLKRQEKAERDGVLASLSLRGALYQRLIEEAGPSRDFRESLQTLIKAWLNRWQTSPVDQLLPGFCDEMGAPSASET